MPKYEYRCRNCGEQLEVVQSFSDDPLTECPACGGLLRKVFQPVGIAFKGSGFYKTDSRTKAGAGASRSSGSSDSSTSSDSSGDGAKADGAKGDGAKSGDGATARDGSKSSTGSSSAAAKSA
ncbi:MAG TPA: FmdB family zinc ribbon protein [Acidimicrobiales bacterium]|nr:FmdB family zinc ribbon protein [Acidimicrobiales bacterium]